MLSITTFPAGFGEISASPFSAKALCLLEMAGRPYERVTSLDPRKAPKAKFPFLEDGGQIIPDSDFIRTHLEQKFGLDFDEGLSDQDRAVSRAMISMAEDGLYFFLVVNRWVKDEHWPTTREELFSLIPKLMRNFVTGRIRKGVAAGAHWQGAARFSEKERVLRVRGYCDAFAGQLGDKPFLFGDRPTAADASVVPMLWTTAAFPTQNAISDVVLKNLKLMAYMERGKSEMYPK
jgi:glutathione S-transferase